jgi:phenylalanyl-tRNA synthetase alpha chain
MEKRKPPFKIVAPGRVYRKDDVDATHFPVFHQVFYPMLKKIWNNIYFYYR